MSNLALLPQYRISQGVGSNEDWNLSLVVSFNGAPIDLSGITFTANVGSFDPITANGDASGVVSFTRSAAQKASWLQGVYGLSIVATASDGTRALTARSSLTVGFARSLVAEQLDTGEAATLLAVSAIVDSISSLPVETGGVIPVDTGKAYITASGFVVVAQ